MHDADNMHLHDSTTVLTTEKNSKTLSDLSILYIFFPKSPEIWNRVIIGKKSDCFLR